MFNVNSFPEFRLRPVSRKSRAIAARFRLGNDLVWIPEIQRSVTTFGERYLRRMFSQQELADCRGSDASRYASLAARVAGKEAVMKLLRPSRDTALPWLSIEILRDQHGSPHIRLHGAASRLATRAGLHDYSISLSHDQEYALATVIANIGS
jgi:holo-[acyl-carrier protein] synthase